MNYIFLLPLTVCSGFALRGLSAPQLSAGSLSLLTFSVLPLPVPCCNGLPGHDGNIITAWQCFSYPPHSPPNVKRAQKHGIYGTGCDVSCYCWICEPVNFGLFSTMCCAECIMSQRPHCSSLGVGQCCLPLSPSLPCSMHCLATV